MQSCLPSDEARPSFSLLPDHLGKASRRLKTSAIPSKLSGGSAMSHGRWEVVHIAPFPGTATPPDVSLGCHVGFTTCPALPARTKPVARLDPQHREKTWLPHSWSLLHSGRHTIYIVQSLIKEFRQIIVYFIRNILLSGLRPVVVNPDYDPEIFFKAEAYASPPGDYDVISLGGTRALALLLWSAALGKNKWVARN